MLAFVVSAALGFAAKPDLNPCAGTKPKDVVITNATDGSIQTILYDYFENRQCATMMDVGFNINLPQAGMDITNDGEYGDNDYSGLPAPILGDYLKHDPMLCPVNVHWHLGAEHRSEGEFDESGKGPHPYELHGADNRRRQLAPGQSLRQGMLCHHYDESDTKFTKPYAFKYCKDLEVGQTYEVHWPHSAAGDCGTKWQYQYPFYDGVFCNNRKDGYGSIISIGNYVPFNVPQRVGVEGQVFTIVNSDDEMYEYDALFWGAWRDGEDKWTDVAKYLGSTTGQSRSNEICSMYSPITWQVDRKCHMISAKSFDKLCKDILDVGNTGGDDMTMETYSHGARELVNDEWTSDTVYTRL